jgi:hypothetical protein
LQIDAMDSNIAAALIGAVATVTAAVITIIYTSRRDRSPPSNELDEILERLERYRQRATFGAVAGLLGLNPLTLFNGYPRTPRTSWVVSKTTGKPTGQGGSAVHPDLLKNPYVISNSAALKAWLKTHP